MVAKLFLIFSYCRRVLIIINRAHSFPWKILPNSANQFAKFCGSPRQNHPNFEAYRGLPFVSKPSSILFINFSYWRLALCWIMRATCRKKYQLFFCFFYGAVLPRRRPHYVSMLSICPSVRSVPPPRGKTKRRRKTKLGRKGPWDTSTPWTNFKVPSCCLGGPTVPESQRASI